MHRIQLFLLLLCTMLQQDPMLVQRSALRPRCLQCCLQALMLPLRCLQRCLCCVQLAVPVGTGLGELLLQRRVLHFQRSPGFIQLSCQFCSVVLRCLSCLLGRLHLSGHLVTRVDQRCVVISVTIQGAAERCHGAAQLPLPPNKLAPGQLKLLLQLGPACDCCLQLACLDTSQHQQSLQRQGSRQ